MRQRALIGAIAAITLGSLGSLGTRASAQTTTPGWSLQIPDRVELSPGASGTLPIAISVEHGQTISKDAALVIDLAPDGGVAVKRRRLGRGDAIEPDAAEPRFAVPLHADAAGDFRVKIHVRFWLCGQKVCRPIDARHNVAVSVAATPPAR